MNADYGKAKDMYDRAMEEVFAKVDVSKAYLEQLSVEVYDFDLSEKQLERLDKLLSKAIVSLEGL